MYIVSEPMKCSKCGVSRTESFFRTHESGIRCLNCGHENITQRITQTDNAKQDAYYKHKKLDRTF